MESSVSTPRIVSTRRSIVKAVSYRFVILCLDFVTIYWFTGTVKIAVGFMIISNLYTTAVYVAHERLWARIQWGVTPAR